MFRRSLGRRASVISDTQINIYMFWDYRRMKVKYKEYIFSFLSVLIPDDDSFQGRKNLQL